MQDIETDLKETIIIDIFVNIVVIVPLSRKNYSPVVYRVNRIHLNSHDTFEIR